MEHLVYLAGPIKGLSYEQATGWREVVKENLGYHAEIRILDPMRGKEHLKGEEKLDSVFYDAFPVCTARGIVNRDYYDINRCDLMLVNFIQATDFSIGTMAEIGAMSMLRKPYIVVMRENSPYNHPFVTERALYIVDSLLEGIELVKTALLPTPRG